MYKTAASPALEVLLWCPSLIDSHPWGGDKISFEWGQFLFQGGHVQGEFPLVVFVWPIAVRGLLMCAGHCHSCFHIFMLLCNCIYHMGQLSFLPQTGLSTSDPSLWYWHGPLHPSLCSATEKWVRLPLFSCLWMKNLRLNSGIITFSPNRLSRHVTICSRVARSRKLGKYVYSLNTL